MNVIRSFDVVSLGATKLLPTILANTNEGEKQLDDSYHVGKPQSLHLVCKQINSQLISAFLTVDLQCSVSKKKERRSCFLSPLFSLALLLFDRST